MILAELRIPDHIVIQFVYGLCGAIVALAIALAYIAKLLWNCITRHNK